MKKRYSEEQIIGFLREAEAGIPVKELCRKHGFSDAAFYLWRTKFAGMSVSEAKRLRRVGDREHATQEAAGRGAAKKVVTAPARRELVRSLVTRLSERRALAVVGMSASALRYQSRPDGNDELREHIQALAHRHRRYGGSGCTRKRSCRYGGASARRCRSASASRLRKATGRSSATV